MATLEIAADYIPRKILASELGNRLRGRPYSEFTLIAWEKDGKGPPVTRMWSTAPPASRSGSRRRKSARPPHSKTSPPGQGATFFSFPDHHHRIKAMDILPEGPACKPTLGRERLRNKRACETVSFERNGSHYQMTIGFYADGRVGCTLETITHALKRDSRGEAASPIGAAMDQIR